MKVKDLEDFQKNIRELLELYEKSVKANEKILSLSDEQKAKLKQEPNFLENLGNPPSISSITESAEKINLNISQLLKKLNDLNIKNKKTLQLSDIQEMLYCVQLIRIQAQQLIDLAERTKAMLQIEPAQSKRFEKLEKVLFNIQDDLPKGSLKPNLLALSLFFNMVHKRVPVIIQALQTKPVVNSTPSKVVSETATATRLAQPKRPVSAKSIKTSVTIVDAEIPHLKPSQRLPKWLEDAIKLSDLKGGLRQKYLASGRRYVLQRLLGGNKTRRDQLKLMEMTLQALKISHHTPEMKTKIARGLMLVIKHKIAQEGNRYVDTYVLPGNTWDSRMGVMVDEYINSPDDFNGSSHAFTATESIDAFAEFSAKLSSTPEINNDTKKTQKAQIAQNDMFWATIKNHIQKAQNDAYWAPIKTTIYQLHQEIKTIKHAISVIPIPNLENDQNLKLEERKFHKFSRIYRSVQDWGTRPLTRMVLTEEEDRILRVTTHEPGMSYLTDYVFERILRNATRALQEMLAKLREITTPPEIYLQLVATTAMIADYDYLIKIAELQFIDRNNDPNEKIKLQKFFDTLATPLLEEVQTEYKKAIALLTPLPEQPIEHLVTASSIKKGGLGFPAYKHSQNRSKYVEKTEPPHPNTKVTPSKSRR